MKETTSTEVSQGRSRSRRRKVKIHRHESPESGTPKAPETRDVTGALEIAENNNKSNPRQTSVRIESTSQEQPSRNAHSEGVNEAVEADDELLEIRYGVLYAVRLNVKEIARYYVVLDIAFGQLTALVCCVQMFLIYVVMTKGPQASSYIYPHLFTVLNDEKAWLDALGYSSIRLVSELFQRYFFQQRILENFLQPCFPYPNTLKKIITEMYANDYRLTRFLASTAALSCVLASSLIGTPFGVPAFVHEVSGYNLVDELIMTHMRNTGIGNITNSNSFK